MVVLQKYMNVDGNEVVYIRLVFDALSLASRNVSNFGPVALIIMPMNRPA